MFKRYAIVPSGNEDVASSRIRAFGLGAALVRRGHQVAFKFYPGCQVLYIQKKWTVATLKAARLAKARHVPIIFDLDDVQFEDLVGPLFRRMLLLADVVTTDTLGKKCWIEKTYGISRVEVIPDAIDYFPKGPVRSEIRETPKLRVLWFGSHSNIRLFRENMDLLSACPEVQVVVIAHKSDVAEYATLYPRVEFIPWSQEQFLQHLQSCDLTCLTHNGSETDLLRSNNKMIVSINWGVPALVSNTPEYARTANELGVGETVFHNSEELLMAIARMQSPDARRRYLEQTQMAVWQNYSPDAIAEKFDQLVDESGLIEATEAMPKRSNVYGTTLAWVQVPIDEARQKLWRTKRLLLALGREGLSGVIKRLRRA